MAFDEFLRKNSGNFEQQRVMQLESNCCLLVSSKDYFSALHHEFHPLKLRDVPQRVAGNGNYVRELIFFYGVNMCVWPSSTWATSCFSSDR
jgi:hypothetical protein